MKRYAILVLAVISLNSWGSVPGIVSHKPEDQQAGKSDKRNANSSLASGLRGTTVVKAEGEQKGGLRGFFNSGPRSTKIVKPEGEQKKGLNGLFSGGTRSTKIVRPDDAKR